MPGKNPTATAAPAKRGHRGALPAGAGLVESMPVGEGVDPTVDEAEDDLELLPGKLVALSMTHCESLSHE